MDLKEKTFQIFTELAANLLRPNSSLRLASKEIKKKFVVRV